MPVYLVMILAIPVLISLIGLISSRGKITLKEFAVQEVVMVLLVAMGYGISMWTSTHDVEIWSGKITEKAKKRVSCEHSYQCNPYPCPTKEDPGRICWNTCYEHDYDYDWMIYASNGEKIEIDRVDSQGNNEPPRWRRAFVGEPTAQARDFTNYIKANPESILRRRGATEHFKDMLPEYPNKVYDYYYCDRFVTIGLIVPDAKAWNNLLSEINADLGAKKKMNVVVVVANTPDRSYQYALEESWIGGKKNDLIVVIGAPRYPQIEWVAVSSWSKAEDLKVELRDAILNLKTLEERDKICGLIYKMTDEKFIHRSMKDFKYLMAGVQPGPMATIVLFILALGASLGLTVYFWKNDPFEEGGYRYYR